jgi:hypothetical protein
VSRKGDFATSLEEVQELLRQRGTDLNRVHLVPGFYDEVLQPAHGVGEVACLCRRGGAVIAHLCLLPERTYLLTMGWIERK